MNPASLFVLLAAVLVLAFYIYRERPDLWMVIGCVFLLAGIALYLFTGNTVFTILLTLPATVCIAISVYRKIKRQHPR